ncbi:glycosyltransferase family 2 protein [Sphingomonas faeni]|uniref:glycosyltransferase family 2 protein n=1 Tax=Sphingomonas faeni TaxID=185950 RepID=UPI0033541778
MTGEKVSVVIPTRDRPDTLAKSLLTVINQTHRNIEVIVSNNGNNPETNRVIEAIGDSRVRCVQPSASLSMSHNFEFAMQHATGDLIALIGDDDGILPTGIERAVAMMRESGAEALASVNCTFRWPIDQQSQQGVYLSVPMTSGWSWRDSRTVMRRVLERDLSFNEAPTTYTGGVISSQLYDRIKQVRGSFYQSQIPDTFSAFAFLSVTDRYILAHEPLMIAGVSGHSHGQTALGVKSHSFNEDPNIPFHSDLPLPEEGRLTFSFQALLYESYLQTQYLRTDNSLTTIKDQVVATVAYAKAHRNWTKGGDKAYDACVRWARTMAAHHNLDVQEIEEKAKRLSFAQASSQYRQTVRDFLTRYVIDDKIALNISDVYQASIVAESIRLTKPNRLHSYRRTFARKIRKSIG